MLRYASPVWSVAVPLVLLIGGHVENNKTDTPSKRVQLTVGRSDA